MAVLALAPFPLRPHGGGELDEEALLTQRQLPVVGELLDVGRRQQLHRCVAGQVLILQGLNGLIGEARLLELVQEILARQLGLDIIRRHFCVVAIGWFQGGRWDWLVRKCPTRESCDICVINMCRNSIFI